MKEAAEIAKKIREDIESQRNKYRYVDSKQLCELCKFPVLSRAFYIFPCQHVYHCSCLLQEMKNHLTKEVVDDVDRLSKTINEIELNQESNPTLDEDSYQEQLNKLKEALDKIVAHECNLCGDIMIESITKPFISQESSTWNIID